MRINVIGNILGTSGYDVHTRNLANALSKVADVKLSTMVPQGAETLLIDKEIEMIKKTDGDINLIITSPIYWKLHTNAKRNWVFLVFEGDRVPKSFIAECLNPDIEYIFVPSEHTKQAILNTIPDWTVDNPKEIMPTEILDKIKIIPHGVNLDLFYPKQKPQKFTFICNKGFRHLEDRGGIQYALQAYLEEFTNKDKVNMIIKINPAYGVPDMKKLLEELKPKDKTDFAPMQINIDNINYNSLVDLYNKAHVLVAPSRSESFGIPGIEAMACGLPVITTNFGGQTDYCNKENSWIVGGEMTEVTWELMYEGVRWLTPDIKELRKAMRDAYTTNLDTKRQKALETAKQFTWDNSAIKIINLMEANMPRRDKTGPPTGAKGPRDGRGQGKGRAPGKGVGKKTGGKKGTE